MSVLCPTFQHADFIADALDGFLGQDTNFAFEIIVRDDASIDGTAEIVQSYAERYPNIVRAVLETSNTWPETKPHEMLLPLARGRYVIICEGDDYWIDARHLARSVALLDGNPALSAVVSPCWIVHEGAVTGLELPDPDVRWNYYLPVRSVLYRQRMVVPWVNGAAGDMSLALALQRAGRVQPLKIAPPVVHVRHVGGIHAGLSYAEKKIANIESLLHLAVWLAEVDETALAEQYRAYAEMKVRKVLRDFVAPVHFDSNSTPDSRSRARIRRAINRLRRRG